ncbi:MAG: hypothetical protein ACFCD0_06990 [Gemmataceae bacterium]
MMKVKPTLVLTIVLATYFVVPHACQAQFRYRRTVNTGSVRFGGARYRSTTVRRGFGGPVGYRHYGSVRYGRYSHRRYFGTIGRTRFSYSSTYIRRFPVGYRSLYMGGFCYYYYPTLPIGYQTVTFGGSPYYVYNNVYYQPYLYGGRTVYVVMPPP